MKKLYYLRQHERQGITCIFEYYNRETENMQPCGKPAVFRLGNRKYDGLCEECGKEMSGRGFLTVAPDNMEYVSASVVLQKFDRGFEREVIDSNLEDRKYILGLYHEIEPIASWGHAHVRVKALFNYFKQKGLKVTRERLRDFARMHYWLIYKSKDPYWESQPFTVTALSDYIIKRIFREGEVKVAKKKRRTRKYDFSEVLKGTIYDPNTRGVHREAEPALCDLRGEGTPPPNGRGDSEDVEQVLSDGP